MRIYTSFVSLASLLSLTYAGSAIVTNKCDFPIFVRSIEAGGQTTYTTRIGPRVSYAEPYLGPGRAIKLSREDLARPGPPVPHLIFGYTVESSNPEIVWTSIADKDGDPFSGHEVLLTGSCDGGNRIEWKNGVDPGGIVVKHCDANRNLNLDICA